MVDIVEVLPEVDYQCVAIPAMTKIKPPQVLLEPSPGEGYALAFDTCPVIMDHVRSKCWAQNAVRQGMLQNHILDGKCLNKPLPSLLVQDKFVWFSWHVDAIPHNFIQF